MASSVSSKASGVASSAASSAAAATSTGAAAPREISVAVNGAVAVVLVAGAVLGL